MRRTKTLWVVSLVALSLVAGGCTALSRLLAGAFRKPQVNFKTAHLQELSLGGATVDLVWGVRNPNPFGLELASVDYNFLIEGKQLAAGRPARGLDLRANGISDLSFPVSVRFQELVPALQQLLTRESVGYKAEGTVGIRTPIGVLSFPLAYEGTFPVPKLPEVRLQAPRITSLAFDSATVEFPLVVTNRNGFALPISGLQGGVAIAGSNVGSLSTGDLGALEANATREVRLPLRIQFAQALSAANALRSGAATVSFTGEVQSGGVALPLTFSQRVNFTR
jgi:LEA14-like dessication related protein